MENQLIYKPKYYQDNYFNINSLLEKFKNCKISNNKYLYLQKIYLNTTNKINWDTYQVNIRDSCHYLKFELFHDNEWFQEISIQSNFKFTKQNIEREINSKSEYLELKNKYFIAPILKLKNICIYGIIIINEKKEELDKIISDKNRKIIFFSDIRNMNNPNEYYNIIKNIKTTTFNKCLIDSKIPIYISGSSPMNSGNIGIERSNELYIYLYKLIDNISNYLPRFTIKKFNNNNNNNLIDQFKT